MGSSRANSVVVLLFCLILMASGGVMAGSYNLSNIEEVIPSSLVVPQGNDVQQVLFATGVQIYVYNSTAWVLQNVSADLYNFKGLKVGHHYFLSKVDRNGGQASWKTYSPVTRVTGKRVAGVSQDDSIDWLLLEATSHYGRKFFGASSFVQRLYTQHGLPPSAEVPAMEGDVFESNYTSLYAFYAKNAYAAPSPSSY